jgi:hypothetical protein
VRVLERERRRWETEEREFERRVSRETWFPVFFSRVRNPIQIAEGQLRADLCVLPFAVDAGLRKTWFEFHHGLPHLLNKNDEFV